MSRSTPRRREARPPATAIAAAVACVAALAGCDYAPVQLVITLPAGVDAGDVTLRASVFAPAAQAGIDCDKIAFGDVGRDALFSSKVLEAEVTDGGDVGRVPRTGDKLVLVDAIDAAGGVVASGCGAVPPIKVGAPVVDVTLERGAVASFSDPTALLVVRDFTGGTSFAHVEDATDGRTLGSLDLVLEADGAPVDGTVRLTALDAEGAALGSLLVDVKGGAAAVDLTKLRLTRAGPFVVTARARFAAGADPPPVQGIVAFANPDVDVDGLAAAQAVIPAAPAAFVTLGPAAGDANHAHVSVATVSGSAGAFTTSSESADVPPARDAAVTAFVGTFVDGGATRAVVNAQSVLGEPICGTVGSRCAVVVPGGAALGAVTPRAGAVAGGACPGDSPFVIAAESDLLAITGSPPALEPVSFTGNTSLASSRVDGSACAATVEGGELHRFVRSTLDLSAVGFTASFLIDAHGGVVDPATPIDVNAVSAPGLASGPAIATDPATGLLLLPVASLGGFEVGSFTLDGAEAFETTAELRVPFRPVAIAPGHFTRPGDDSDAELAVLVVPGPDDDTGGRDDAQLIIAGPKGADGARVAGALPLGCVAPGRCRMIAADVDGDGVDEVLVGRLDDNGAHAEIFRFGNPG